MKRCLKKILFNARLNYEELLTVLKEIENIVNNRPLVHMYDDVNQELLTQNKLLFGRNLELVASAEKVEVEHGVQKRAKHTDTRYWNTSGRSDETNI